jgi:hypothetical protein
MRPPWQLLAPKIYEHISDQYNELGQLELGEEGITVQDHVFAQIGVLDEDGVRSMWRAAVSRKFPRHGVVSDEEYEPYGKDEVFCDLGSGVGNICLQVLAETDCSKAVGVEVIPSRHRTAVRAFQNALKYFPEVFQNKSAVFVERDIVGCEKILSEEKVTVLYSHSWMFDDELMNKVGEIVANVPSLRCVVSSRPIEQQYLAQTNLNRHSLMHFSADWNEQAPFHVYHTS